MLDLEKNLHVLRSGWNVNAGGCVDVVLTCRHEAVAVLHLCLSVNSMCTVFRDNCV